MNRLFTIAAATGIAASASVASANVEIGGTAGVHVFSSTNELGVADIKGAPSERNSALFGLRLGMMFSDMLGIEGELGVIPSESRREVFDVSKESPRDLERYGTHDLGRHCLLARRLLQAGVTFVTS